MVRSQAIPHPAFRRHLYAGQVTPQRLLWAMYINKLSLAIQLFFLVFGPTISSKPDRLARAVPHLDWRRTLLVSLRGRVRLP